MKKFISLLLLILVFSSKVEAQKKSWFVFQPNSQGKNIRFNGNIMQLSNSNYFAPIHPFTKKNFANYLSLNAQTDTSGNLVLYVLSTIDSVFVFDHKNNFVSAIKAYDISPIIVPMPDGLTFHLFIGSGFFVYRHYPEDESVLNLSRSVSSSVKINVQPKEKENGAVYVQKRSIQMIKNQCDTHVYKLHAVTANLDGMTGRYLISTTITTTKSNWEYPVFSRIDTTNITQDSGRFEYSISEVEINPNKNFFAYTSSSVLYAQQIVSKKLIGNWYKKNLERLYNDSGLFILGQEFLNDSILLYSMYSIYDTNSVHQGVFKIKLTDKGFGAPSKIINSEKFKFSYLEMGGNQKIYAANNKGYYYYSATVDSFIKESTVNITPEPTIDFLTQKLNGEYDGPPVKVYYFQNHIDGFMNETYVNTKSVVDSVIIKSNKAYTSSNHDLTELKKGPIYVMSHVKIYNTAKNVSFDGMQFYFHENAKFDIVASNKVQFLGTTLMGTCGAMWQGVKLMPIDTGINVVFGKNSSNLKSLVRDAAIGLKSIHSKNRITIKDSTKFTANVKDVEISNGLIDRINIYNSLFIDTARLNHRNKKTTVGIQLDNSFCNIGKNNFGKNIIIGNEIGINVLNSKYVQLDNCSIEHCEFGANMDNVRRISIKNSQITYCGTGVKAYLFLTFDFVSNSVLNSYNKVGYAGIGLDLNTILLDRVKIGGQKSEKNTFSSIANYSVRLLKKNAILNTSYFPVNEIEPTLIPVRPAINPLNWKRIEISNNVINGSLSHTGIAIVGTEKWHIDTCLIQNNKIESGLGISLTYAILNNCVNYLIPTKDNINDCYGKKNICENSFVVKVNKNYNLSNNFGTGILLKQCEKILVGHNKFVGFDSFYTNVGINLLNSTSCLIYRDTFWGFNNGVRLKDNCMYSNVYCNYFDRVLFGIVLDKSTLRNNNYPLLFSSLPYNKRVHGLSVASGASFESRDNSFVNIRKGGTCINNDKIYNIFSNKWDFSNTDTRRVNFVSSKNLRGFVMHDNAINYCGVNSNNSSTSNLDSVISTGINSNENDSFWMNYYIAEKAFRGEIVVNNANSFSNQIVELENSIKTNTLGDMQAKWNALSANTQKENELKYVLGKRIDYLSNYDTLYNRTSKSDNFKNWINDSFFTNLNIMVDTSLFVVNHKMLNDSVIQQLYTIAIKDPYKVSFAAFFARAFLQSLGKDYLYYDSIEPTYLSLVGQVTNSCNGGGASGILVKLLRQNGTYTGLSTTTEDFGYFQFDGISMKDLNHQDNYFVKAYFPNDTLHTTFVSTLENLINDSMIIIDCLFPTPPQLGTKSNEKKYRGFISPIPVIDNIHIENMEDCMGIELVNNIGQVVKRSTNNLKSGEMDIDVKDLTNGVYFVKLYYSDSTFKSTKIIIRK